MKDCAAIFDIGSNAVRLVIYGGPARAPVKIHNERNLCGLGASLSATGGLDPEGVVKALDSLRRFAGLVAALKISDVRAVATAAVREARDGPAFMEKIRKEFGLEVKVIGGEEEARLSALGVMMNGLGAEGIIGDYGGGSLELIAVSGGKVRGRESLPVGSHRLHALSTRAQRVKYIDAQLDGAKILQGAQGAVFTALGGAWRSMARAHMHFSRYPLRVLDHYAVEGRRALEFAELLSRQGPVSLEKTVGLGRKRARDVGVAALVMERLFARLGPARLVYSGTGLREGLLFDGLPAAARREDPLLSSCAAFARRESRFSDLKPFLALKDWVAPLFAGEGVERLVEAACLLSDICGLAHEDYQAAEAFRRALVLPFYGAGHGDRAFIALALYVRYKGYLRQGPRAKDAEEITRPAQRLLDGRMTGLALRLGLALRAGYLLTGGALGLLAHAEFAVGRRTLGLKLDGRAAALDAAAVASALEDIAAAMGRTAA